MSVALFLSLLLVPVNQVARVLALIDHTALLGEESKVNSNCIILSKRKNIEAALNVDLDLTKCVLMEVFCVLISHIMAVTVIKRTGSLLAGWRLLQFNPLDIQE